MSTSLFNGAPAPDLALHRALHYGDGVFRTCFIYSQHVIDLNEQCELVNADAERLGLAPVPMETLRREARDLAVAQARGVLKIMLLRGGRARGYRRQDPATDRLLCRYPATTYPAAAWDRGVHVARSDFRLAAQPALAGIKHLNRLEQVLASRDWPDGIDELLVSDDRGRPVSGTRTNLFWVSGGVVRTPTLDRCGVSGHMRRKVLSIAGVRARLGEGNWEEVEAADEVFLTNSLIGIWPVARLGARQWTAPGPVTRELTARLSHPRLVAA
jgi:4-amino-4-deoxychorismate lyase